MVSPNANVGWLAVEAAAGFQADHLGDIRFLAKEFPGDPWGWVARTWRNGSGRGPHDAAALARAEAPRARGHRHRIAIRRRHAPTSVLVLWLSHGADAAQPVLVTRLQRAAGLLGLALDKLQLEAERAAAGSGGAPGRGEVPRASSTPSRTPTTRCDVRGKPVYHNAAFARMLGYERGETLDRRQPRAPDARDGGPRVQAPSTMCT